MHVFQTAEQRPVEPVCFQSSPLAKKLLLPGSNCQLHATHSERRQALEGYIAAKFKSSHNAQITEFLPQLMALECQGRFTAAAGVRHGLHQPLFVESYLDQPLEEELAQLGQGQVNRAQLIEVGNLVATWRGASQLLFILLTASLERAGFKWVVFTATPVVEQMLRKLKFSPFSVCKADVSRIGPQQEQWGNYYDTNPHVLAGNLESSMQQAREHKLVSLVLSNYAETIDRLALQLINMPV